MLTCNAVLICSASFKMNGRLIFHLHFKMLKELVPYNVYVYFFIKINMILNGSPGVFFYL